VDVGFEVETAEPGDTARWLNAVLRERGVAPRSQELLALVERWAPRLRQDGVPVDAVVDIGNAINADLDVIDLLVATVPTRTPTPHTFRHEPCLLLPSPQDRPYSKPLEASSRIHCPATPR
jgi:hypothetical protein